MEFVLEDFGTSCQKWIPVTENQISLLYSHSEVRIQLNASEPCRAEKLWIATFQGVLVEILQRYMKKEKQL